MSSTQNDVTTALTAGVAHQTGAFRYDVAEDRWWWSDEVYRMHGFEPGEVVPTTAMILAHKHPDDRARYAGALTSTSLLGGSFASVHRILDAQGEERVLATIGEAQNAYESGRCDTFTTDGSGLYGVRLALKNPDEHVVLPEIISKEPLGIAVRQGDDQWFNVVKWVYFALVQAEEAGVTQANVDDMLKSDKPDIKRLLGTEGDFGKQLGLDNQWAYRIIKQVGNYGEVFDRNLGSKSPLKIERGLNALWTDKGLQYSPPIR